MLEREGIDVTLESGPYGSFKVRVDDEVVVDGGSLAFLGVLPSLKEIRAQVKEHGVEGREGDGAKRTP